MARLSIVRSALFAAAAMLAFSGPSLAAVDHAHQYPAVRVAAPPAFDPTLSDPAWKMAVSASGFEDITTRRPAPLETAAYLLYDAQNLYVGFKAAQGGVPIHDEASTNDVGFGQDDAVGICIDTSGSGQEAYCFETTPRGVRYQQSTESARYAPPWQAKAAVDGDAWSAMLVIPLKDLRAAGGASQTWRFNFIRICAGTGDHYSWAYDGLMQDAQPPNWPIFTDARWWPALTQLQIAASGARPQPRLELYGLESAGRDRNVFQQANNTFADETVRHEGLDFTYPITSTIAAVGTLNPDFSNVEVDQQTIVPQEFQRNLTEYRPFFAQGGQIFSPDALNPPGGFDNAPDQVFYTPSIGTFDRGFKMEGTYGLQSVGALEVRGLAADGSTIDDEAFALRHILTDRTFIWYADGVLAHHDIGDDSAINTGVAGRDLNTGFVYGYNQTMELQRFVLDPSQTFAFERNGFVDVHKPNYEVFQGYQDISPGFGPLDGFTTIADARGPVDMMNFTGTTPGLKSYQTFLTADRFTTRDGTVHEADFFGSQDVVTNQLVHANLSVNVSELDDPILTGGRMLPFNNTSLTLGYRDGTPAPIDGTFGEGNFSDFYLQQFNVSTSRQLNTRLSLQATYAGTHERSPAIGVDGQLLRSVAIGESLGPDTNVTLALRSINGLGGFAVPGVNLAAGFHEKFRNGSEFFLNYGTPAAPATLDRLIVKYLLRFGGGAGT